MGFIFGKYAIYLQFSDGTKGYFMAKQGDHVMTTSSFANAEKFMSRDSAESYFYRNDIASGSNTYCARVTGAWTCSDGKFFRMG